MSVLDSVQLGNSYAHRAAIALGSNLGDSKSILTAAIEALDQGDDIQVLTQSHYYQTAPVGPPQPDFLNACVVVATNLPPTALLHRLMQIEAQFGRMRDVRWGARTLDLDLLLFDDLVLISPTLEVPHPRMRQRAFVLVPLAEIAADWVDPVSGKAIAELLETTNCLGVKGIEPTANQ